jgi:hypothetical protein
VALSADTVWEVRTGGNDDNGGGFVTGASGTDRSQQDAAHATLTTASVVHSTTTQINVAVGDFTVSAADVGNIIQVSVNGGALAYYQITVADVPNNRWTVDRSLGTAGQTVAGSMGGALASPGGAAAAATVTGNLIWVKAGTYTLSTATPGKGGPVLFASTIIVKMEGYSATRGDRAGRPVLSAGAQTTLSLFAPQGAADQQFVHLQADGNNGSGVSGFVFAALARPAAIDCVAVDCDQASAVGFSATASATHPFQFCKASNCTTGFTGGSLKCWADGCGTGFNIATLCAQECLATDCTGDGFSASVSGTKFFRCTSDGNGGDGFDVAQGCSLTECLATNNTGFGINGATSGFLFNCASYNNTAGRTDLTSRYDWEPITLSVDPYTNAAADDYSLNNTAGGGADLRAAGIDPPGQTDNADIGALQHADPAASGGARPYGLQPIPYGV